MFGTYLKVVVSSPSRFSRTSWLYLGAEVYLEQRYSQDVLENLDGLETTTFR